MLHFRVNFAIQPRSPSPKHFPAFLPSQNQFSLTPFFSQPSVLPLPQLLSFDNHLDCLCPNSKTPLSRSVMNSNPSPINNIANSAPRCQHRFANYKQCRLPASAESPLCPHHAKLAQSRAAVLAHIGGLLLRTHAAIDYDRELNIVDPTKPKAKLPPMPEPDPDQKPS